MRILNVVGARPNLMKMAPIVAEMARCPELDPPWPLASAS